MYIGRRGLLIVVATICAASFPAGAFAQDVLLTGSVDLTWNLYQNGVPYNGSGQYNTAYPITVGSTLSCPLGDTTGICGAFGMGGSYSWGVGTNSITYTGNGPSGVFSGSFNPNSWTFSGLTFSNGASLAGFTITNNTIGLTASDITITGSSLTINLAGLQTDGTFTIDLTPAPEPSSSVLCGSGLLVIILFAVRGRRDLLGNRAAPANFG